MKSLPQFVEDMKATAELLREQAEHLEDLARFFGAPMGPAVVTARAAPQLVPSLRQEVKPEPEPQPEPQPDLEPTAALTIEPKKRGRPPGKTLNSRMMTKAEKAEIKQDWEALPPQLRTKTNRAALAAKYNCSPVQVYAITRDKEELQRNLRGGQEKARAKLSHQPQPQAALRSHGGQ